MLTLNLNGGIFQPVNTFFLLIGLFCTVPAIDGRSSEAGSAPAGGVHFQEIRSLLDSHCAKCHGEKKQKGGVDLSPFSDQTSALKKYKLWQAVLEEIDTKDMPPDDEADVALNDADRAKLTNGVRSTLALLETDYPALRDPGPSLIRRLTRTEINNVFRDVTALDLDVANEVGLPEESTGSSFDNIAAALNLPQSLLEKYIAAADLVLTRLVPEYDPDAERKDEDRAKRAREFVFKDFPETPKVTDARDLLRTLARRAWRRPITVGDLDRLGRIYEAAAAEGAPPRVAAAKAMKAIFISPEFLFRIEEDRTPKQAPADGSRAAAQVTPVELASRFSFFLWSSVPDEALLSAAEDGTLSRPDVVESQVRRMLADPKAKALTQNFFLRWLHADHIDRARPSKEFFPEFKDDLKREMSDEVTSFCDNLRTEDRPILDLIRSDYTFANDDLAKFYGIDGVTSHETKKIPLNSSSHRGGVLGMGAVLASTSHVFRTSPSQRGKWVLDVIFNTPPPPPPPNAGMFKDEKQTKEPKDFREKLAQHAQDASCAGCHHKMDPLGFAMDNYNAIGAWRPTSADLDTSGALPTGEKFNGSDELREIIWNKRDQFVRGFITRLLSYALGRETDYFDQNQIAKIKAAADRSNDQLSSIVLQITRSYPFQYRRNADVTNLPAESQNKVTSAKATDVSPSAETESPRELARID